MFNSEPNPTHAKPRTFEHSCPVRPCWKWARRFPAPEAASASPLQTVCYRRRSFERRVLLDLIS